MRALALLLCLGLSLSTPVLATAQSAALHRDGLNKVPQNILDGLDALRRGLTDDAEAAWLKDSALSRGVVNGTLLMFKQHDGEYQGFEVIATQDVTQRIRILYLALNYEQQPHFAKFIAYRTGKEWILLRLDLNVDLTAMETVLANTPHS